MISGAAFYCVSSGLYFPGAAAMINSLRLLGHEEPVFVLDRGLSEAQRDLLSTQATVLEAPSDAEPFMLKTALPAQRPAEVMVLIDVDMIATRSFADLIERAARGCVIGVTNAEDRFVPQWGELLGLGTARRQPYLSSGLVILGGEAGAEAIELMDALGERVDFARTQFSTDFPRYPYLAGEARSSPDYPFFFADQDLLNAILASRTPADRVVALSEHAAPIPPFEGVRIRDERRLRCVARDGTEPFVLHHFLSKPWLEATHHGVYSRLLRRLLVGDDVAIRVPPECLPRRFRRGALAYAERKGVNAREHLRYRLAGAAHRFRGRAEGGRE